jgi:hypothetical protein
MADRDARLPTFLIIGASRSGTTSLHNILSTHPDVFMSSPKEPHYFTYQVLAARSGSADLPEQKYPIRDRAAYARLFAHAGSARAVGESSASYLATPGVDRRVAAALPGIRVVAILRDPARRFYASYLDHVRQGTETRELERAIDDELDRDRTGAPQAPGPSLAGGCYFRHLLRWLEVVPRERMLVLLHDDLVADSDALVRRLCHFLEIATDVPLYTSARLGAAGLAKSPAVDWLMRRLIKRNAVSRRLKAALPPGLRATATRCVHMLDNFNTRRPPMPIDQRARLVAHYAEDIESLGAFLDRDLGAWLRVA